MDEQNHNLPGLGIELLNNGDFNGAIAYYKGLLKTDPENAAYLYNIGAAYDELGNAEKALEYYLKAHKAAPADIEPLNNITAHYLGKGHARDAVTYSEKALRINPDNLETLAYAVHAYYLNGQYDDSIKISERTLKLLMNQTHQDPNLPGIHFAATYFGAYAHSALGQHREALKIAEHMAHMYRDSALANAAYANIAFTSYKSGMYEQHITIAQHAAQNAIQLNRNEKSLPPEDIQYMIEICGIVPACEAQAQPCFEN